MPASAIYRQEGGFPRFWPTDAVKFYLCPSKSARESIMRPHKIEGTLIPQPLRTEVTVVLPPETEALMRDLHDDRQVIGWCIVWALVLVTALVIRYVTGRNWL